MGLTVNCEVNYGTFGRDEVVEVWDKLTATQKTAVQVLYDKIRTVLEQEFLA